MQKLLEADEDQLALIIGLLAKSVKGAQTPLPSFSKTGWADFAARVGLPKRSRELKLDSFQTPIYQLPPSFHKTVFEGSWHAQDVYQELVEQTRE
jgi:hypothetical protein